jgi:hypothetical protein
MRVGAFGVSVYERRATRIAAVRARSETASAATETLSVRASMRRLYSAQGPAGTQSKTNEPSSKVVSVRPSARVETT